MACQNFKHIGWSVMFWELIKVCKIFFLVQQKKTVLVSYKNYFFAWETMTKFLKSWLYKRTNYLWWPPLPLGISLTSLSDIKHQSSMKTTQVIQLKRLQRIWLTKASYYVTRLPGKDYGGCWKCKYLNWWCKNYSSQKIRHGKALAR